MMLTLTCSLVPRPVTDAWSLNQRRVGDEVLRTL